MIEPLDIDAEFDKFFVFDTDDRSYVTSVSAKLFAKHCLDKQENRINDLQEVIEWVSSPEKESSSS